MRDGNAVHRIAIAASVVASLLVAGCAQQFKQEAQSIQSQRIDCRTAPGDLRVLQSEKANVVQQIGMGVTAIYPAGAVAAGAAIGAAGAAAASQNAYAAGYAAGSGYAIGAIYPVLPGGCMYRPLISAYDCAGTWFQSAYGAGGIYYRVIPAP